MRVAGELQAYAGALHDRQSAGHVVEQNAGFGGIQPHPVQQWPQANRACRVAKGHAGDVQPIHGHHLIVQDAHARALQPLPRIALSSQNSSWLPVEK